MAKRTTQDIWTEIHRLDAEIKSRSTPPDLKDIFAVRRRALTEATVMTEEKLIEWRDALEKDMEGMTVMSEDWKIKNTRKWAINWVLMDEQER